jgi:hypothetical protein
MHLNIISIPCHNLEQSYLCNDSLSLRKKRPTHIAELGNLLVWGRNNGKGRKGGMLPNVRVSWRWLVDAFNAVVNYTAVFAA